MFGPFRLRNWCEIVQPLRGAELLDREVQQETLESSMVVVRLLKVPEVLDGFLARRIHTAKENLQVADGRVWMKLDGVPNDIPDASYDEPQSILQLPQPYRSHRA